MKKWLTLILLIPSLCWGLTFKNGEQVNNTKYMYCKQINTGEVTKIEWKTFNCPTGYKKTSASDYERNKKEYGKVVYCLNNSSGKVIKSRSGLCLNNYSITSKQVYENYILNDKSNSKVVKSNTTNQTNQSKSLNKNYTIVTNSIDKNKLKEELKYWKALLDDELISQEDYDLKKNELLNSSNSKTDNVPKNEDNEENSKNRYTYCVKKSNTDNNTHSLNDIIPRESNCLSNETEIKIPYWCNYSSVNDPKLLVACTNRKIMTVNVDTSKVQKNTESYQVKNSNTSNSNTSSNNINTSSNPCSYVRMSSDRCYKKYAKVKKWSDSRLCMNLKDVFFTVDEELYLEEARLRGVTCSNGVAYDSGKAPNIVNSVDPQDYETSCNIIGSGSYSNVKCKTKKKPETTREIVGEILGELLNQLD